MRLKVPFHEIDITSESWIEKTLGPDRMQVLRQRNPFVVKDPTLKEKPKYFMADFREDRISMFCNYQNENTFFEEADRAFIVQQICYSARFGDGPLDVGLKKLILDGVYQAGYSPHDGPVLLEAGDGEPTNERQQIKQRPGLKRDWARFGRVFKYQPYGAIKDYFGSEIALYFAWLGFYTAWLVPLAIVGLTVFFYGIGSAGSHIPVQDVCDEKNRGRWFMCPLCDKHCSYWDLASTTCVYAYVTHFFDNAGTVVLALIASIWGTLFLEFWKRRQATLAHEWHTDDLEKGEETLRPEYSAKVKDLPLKKNKITGKMEPHVRKLIVYSRYGGVLSVILFMVTLVIAAVFGVIVYRAAVFASLSGSSSARMVTSATAGFLNLVAINLLKFVYSKLAVWLTDWENPPTRSDYEYSFTWKMYTFQFVNTYSSVFYIAFFKSRHVIGTPSRYKRLAGEFRLDGCSEQGCFLDLCVQLLFIMVGQQIIRNVLEIGIPFFLYWMKNRKKKEGDRRDRPQYQCDYDLSPHKDHYMFWEYLDVVLQFGFATMFVAAFPLGPFFALLTSIIQIRVDAINFVSQFRRPDSTRAQDIGAWLRILEIVTKMSVLVNAFVLAFTSEFIPKFLYRIKYAPDRDSSGLGSLTGYLDNSLASINISYIFQQEPGTEPKNIQDNLNKVCRYPGYHEPVWPYEVSKHYWEVVAARLAFVFVFQFTVYLVTSFISWLVPNVPKDLKLKRMREKHLFKEKLI
ncbi:anoctamin-3-like [Oculina patagonica]